MLGKPQRVETSVGKYSIHRLFPEESLDARPCAGDALQWGVTVGRGGRGQIYIWSGGNGRGSPTPIDNSNHDGTKNSRFVIAVSATDHGGKRTSYSSPAANLLVNAPGSPGTPDGTIVTTDLTGALGFDPAGDYTSTFNGTSAACPIVAPGARP